MSSLTAAELIVLVPPLYAVEGYIDGLRAGATDCWEGVAAVLRHSDQIVGRIASYVGPDAHTWMSDTDDPRTRTKEAFDTMVEHFFDEYPETPQMVAYLEARKSPEGLDHFFKVTVPAFWADKQ
jgi:hypothetical protein